MTRRFSKVQIISEVQPQISKKLKRRLHGCRALPKNGGRRKFNSSFPSIKVEKDYITNFNISLMGVLTIQPNGDFKRSNKSKSGGLAVVIEIFHGNSTYLIVSKHIQGFCHEKRLSGCQWGSDLIRYPLTKFPFIYSEKGFVNLGTRHRHGVRGNEEDNIETDGFFSEFFMVQKNSRFCTAVSLHRNLLLNIKMLITTTGLSLFK